MSISSQRQGEKAWCCVHFYRRNGSNVHEETIGCDGSGLKYNRYPWTGMLRFLHYIHPESRDVTQVWLLINEMWIQFSALIIISRLDFMSVCKSYGSHAIAFSLNSQSLIFGRKKCFNPKTNYFCLRPSHNDFKIVGEQIKCFLGRSQRLDIGITSLTHLRKPSLLTDYQEFAVMCIKGKIWPNFKRSHELNELGRSV